VGWLSRLWNPIGIGVAPCQTGGRFIAWHSPGGPSPLLRMGRVVCEGRRRFSPGIRNSSGPWSRQLSLGAPRIQGELLKSVFSECSLCGRRKKYEKSWFLWHPEKLPPVVANLSQESRQGLGFCRYFFICPNDLRSTTIRLCDLDRDRRRPIHFAVTSSTPKQMEQPFKLLEE